MACPTSRWIHLTLCVALAGATGCGRETPTGPSTTVDAATSVPGPSVEAASPDPLRLQVELPPFNMVGYRVRPALLTLPSGRLSEETLVRWTISDTSVARFDAGATHESMGYHQPFVTILAPGVVTLTASALGATTGAALWTVAPHPDVSAQLEIESFTLDESYGGGPGAGYTPRATLRNHGATEVVVFGVQFLIPGPDPIPYCWTRRTVMPGQSFELFRMAYGDPDLHIASGVRAQGPGTIQIFFVDGYGRGGRVEATRAPTPADLAPDRPDDRHRFAWACGAPLTPS